MTSPAPAVALGAVHLGRSFQRVGLGEEFLDRVYQVADATGTLAALLTAGCGRRALVLQRVKSVAVKRKLFFELVQQVGGDAVAFAAAVARGGRGGGGRG